MWRAHLHQLLLSNAMFFTDLFLPSPPTKDFCKEVALIHQNVSCPHTAAKLAPATHPTLGMAPENADLSCFGVALLAHWCIHCSALVCCIVASLVVIGSMANLPALCWLVIILHTDSRGTSGSLIRQILSPPSHKYCPLSPIHKYAQLFSSSIWGRNPSTKIQICLCKIPDHYNFPRGIVCNVI